MRSALFAAARRIAHLQLTRPFWMLLVAALSVALAGLAASRLTLKTSFGELLPQGKASVVVANKVNERLPSASTLFIVAEGGDPESLKRFVDALSPEIRALGSDMVGNVDDGTRATRSFLREHRFLYAPLEDVEEVHREITERYEREVQKKAGFDLELDGEEEEAPEPLTKDVILEKIKKREAELEKATPNQRDGYYLEPEGKLIAVMVRTPVSSGDVDRSNELLSKVGEIIARVDPARFAPDIKVSYTGDFITSAEEVKQITSDLLHVGFWGVAMILGVVFLFYLRVRTLLATALSVGIGVAWTFGVAYPAIGHLNASTGFLVSIVVGNGINFGIIFMARYLEARRVESRDASLLAAHRDTWTATLAAAGSAMVAYGSLAVTDFRGFKHFGVIGGTGMILCWLATYLFLPPILVVFEKIWPIGRESPLLVKLRGAYGRPFAYLIQRAPRAVAASGALVGAASLALAAHYVTDEPMEYDMRNIQTDTSKTETVARRLSGRVGRIIGHGGQDSIAIATDRLDQVLPLKETLEKRRDAAPPERKPFDRIVTIHDLLPQDQEKKIELLEDARAKIEKARARGLFSDADWKELEPELPPKDLRPIGIGDLPEQVARPFTEKDGTRGRLVYIVPTSGRSTWDARYLIDWADAFRVTTLPDGSVVKGSGRSVIFADMILTIHSDMPKAILVSLFGTFLIVLVTFRFRAAGFAVMASVALGIAAMIATMALYKVKLPWETGGELELVGMKLNFLNFVAIPISIGVGADYAVNLMHRHRLGGPGGIVQATRETGGALVLCSLTTTLGYFALTLSVNRATQSFGFAAAAGEIACLLSAVLVMPAFLALGERRRAARAGDAAASDKAREPAGDPSSSGPSPAEPRASEPPAESQPSS